MALICARSGQFCQLCKQQSSRSLTDDYHRHYHRKTSSICPVKGARKQIYALLLRMKRYLQGDNNILWELLNIRRMQNHPLTVFHKALAFLLYNKSRYHRIRHRAGPEQLYLQHLASLHSYQSQLSPRSTHVLVYPVGEDILCPEFRLLRNACQSCYK